MYEQDHIFFSPAYEILPSIYNFGHESQVLELIIQGISSFAASGSLTNPVADYLGWQRLNDSFISSKPELSVLSSYPPLWPQYVPFLSSQPCALILFLQHWIYRCSCKDHQLVIFHMSWLVRVGTGREFFQSSRRKLHPSQSPKQILLLSPGHNCSTSVSRICNTEICESCRLTQYRPWMVDKQDRSNVGHRNLQESQTNFQYASF